MLGLRVALDRKVWKQLHFFLNVQNVTVWVLCTCLSVDRERANKQFLKLVWYCVFKT